MSLIVRIHKCLYFKNICLIRYMDDSSLYGKFCQVKIWGCWCLRRMGFLEFGENYLITRIQIHLQYQVNLMKVFIALIFTLLFLGTYSQVLGIDFGTEYWKAALISPGKNLVIVENSRSQRKTLNAISFHEGIRFFEEDTKAKRMRKPNLTYTHLNKLLSSLDTGNIATNYEFNGETYVFENDDKEMTLEQVIGMILNNIKSHASNQAGTDIRDVVLTVPAHWGFKAKMCLINAAHLAQFHVLGLINQNSAAAIHYAISRNDTDPINVMFFNLGSHNLQISVMKMFGHFDENKNKTVQGVQALGHFVKEDIGGLKIDERISHYLAQEFAKKHKMDPKQNLKSFTKLLVKSSEVKEILSANKETQVYIEGLMNGIDLNIPVARDVIDNHEIFEEFDYYLDQALASAKLTKSDIAMVEMIGGASRIPTVNTIVKQYFNDVQVGAHINGDEAMAFGSALRAANLSLTFRVKQLYFNDPMNLDTKIVVSTTDKGVILEQTLFEIDNHHGDKKSLSINENSEDLKLTVYVGEDIVKEFTTKNISDWKQKFKDQNVTGQPNLVVDFMMSSIHIAEIKDMYLNVTVNVTEVKQKVEYVDEEVEIEFEEEEEKKEQAKEQVKEEVKQEETQKQVKEEEERVEQNEESTEQKEREGEQEKKEGEKKMKKKKITKTKTVKSLVQQFSIQPKRHIVSYEEVFSKFKKFTKEQIDEKIKLLKHYESYENELKEKAKLRNDFESALYQIKDSFEEVYLKTFAKEQEIDQLKETVTTEIQWMDENAWTASKQDLEDHFKILTGVYEPIYNRTVQYRNREKTFNETIQYFAAIYKKTGELITSHPWVLGQATDLLVKINETVKELDKKVKEQVERPMNQNPIFYNSEMVKMAQSLKDQYYVLRMIPRPKIQKPKEEPKVQTKEQQETQEETEEETEEEKSDQEENSGQQENKENKEEQKNKEDL